MQNQALAINSDPSLKALSAGFKSGPILTLRGLIIGLLCAYLIFGPVRLEDDIIAGVLSFSLLGLLCAALLLTIFHGLNLRNAFSAQLSRAADKGAQPGQGAAQLYSNQPAVLVLKATPFKILPLFVLKIELQFAERPLPLRVHNLRGSFPRGKFITQAVTFPHRGNWRLRPIKCSYGDRFGLSAVTWQIKVPPPFDTITVSPPPGEAAGLPILSSAIRSGESVLDMNERRGEPFDLKPYHPSDGLRKILWKVYAKSGELISRHLERSMSPEGQVAVFCLASAGDDLTCSQSLAYLRQLEDLNLELFFSCEGAQGSLLARSAQAGKALLVDSVWNTLRSSPRSLTMDLGFFTDQIRQMLGQARIENMLVFCPAARLLKLSDLELYQAAGQFLEAQRIRPIFFMTQNPYAFTPARRSGKQAAGWQERMKAVRAALVHEKDKSMQTTPAFYLDFLALCARNKWEVIV